MHRSAVVLALVASIFAGISYVGEASADPGEEAGGLLIYVAAER